MGAGRGQTKRVRSSVSLNASAQVEVEKLREVGSTIRHCGDCGQLMFHADTGLVWWVAGDADGEGYTHPKETIRRFLAVPGVNDVVVAAEQGPSGYEYEEALENGETMRKELIYDQRLGEERELEVPVKGWVEVEYPTYPPGSLLERAATRSAELREACEANGELMTYFFLNEDTGEVVIFPSYSDRQTGLKGELGETVTAGLGAVEGITSVRIERGDDQNTYSEDEAWIELW